MTLRIKIDKYFNSLWSTKLTALIWDSREPTNHRGQFFPRNDDICSSTLFALFPPICNRFFLAEGGEEEGWRGACQNECDAGGASRLPNKNHVAYSSLAWLLFLFVLSSPSLCFSLLSPLPLRLLHPGPRYTWRTTVLYVALQDAFSRSSSPYPFSINDVNGYLPLHVAPVRRHECAHVLEWRKSQAQSTRYSLRAARHSSEPS